VLVVGAVGVAALAATAVLYSQRGPIGTRLAIDYLQRRGVPATITIERLGPRGFVGSARLGPANDPDLTVERIEVEFAPFPIARNGLAPRVRSIRMVRPRLKARYVDGKLTFGSLQKLVDEFMAQPVVGPPPDVLIEDGAARLATDVGELRVAGDGLLAEGRIVRLNARMGRHRIAGRTARIELDGATLQLRAANDRLVGRFNAAAPSLVQGETAVEGATISGGLDLPYAPGEQGFQGRVGLEATLQARRLVAGDSAVSGAKVVATLGGLSKGPLENLVLDGRGGVAIEADAVSGPTSARDLRWSASSTALHLGRTRRGVSFQGPLQLAGGAAQLQSGEARLSGVRLTGTSQEASGNLDTTGVRLVSAPRLSVVADGGAVGTTRLRRLQLSLSSPELTVADVGEGGRVSGAFRTNAVVGSLDVDGTTVSNLALNGAGEADTVDRAVRLTWRGSARSTAGASGPGLNALAERASAVVVDKAAFSRFLRTVRLDAPDLRLETAGGGGVVTLGAPVRIAGEGGDLVLGPAGETALVEFGASGLRGGLTLASSGPALPQIDLQLPAYRVTEAGIAANARLTAARLNAGPLQGVRLAAVGRLEPLRGGLAFVAAECASLNADQVVGEDGTVATGVALQACPDGDRPMASLAEERWTAHLVLRNTGARLPTVEVEMSRISGVVDLVGGPDGPTAGSVHLASADVADRAAEPRFLALSAAGDAALSGRTWSGDFVLTEQAGKHRLGEVKLSHDMQSGVGSAVVETRDLKFAEGGLQPAQITPLAAPVISKAEGAVSFTGRFGWSAAGLTSDGRVSTAGLDFTAAMGDVRGLKGQIAFVSLAPVATAPDQTITVDHIEWLTPLDNAVATVTVTPTDVRITKAQVGIGGGVAILDPLDLKLGALLPTSGTLRLSDVDLGKLVSQFNLADKMSIEAKVDGVLPFAFTAEGLRFSDGRLFADSPGRISIKREALTGVSASDASAATPPNAMQSFAYQALENLAFDMMDVRISSQPQGRLGLLFHVNGRHDPAVGRTPRVGILDLIRGRAFDKDLPLPKGTPVDLTLDTSLNFDELMAAYSSAGRSTAVQP
jgi:hypothetical protein